MPKKDPTEQIIARHLIFLEAAGFRPVPGEFERIRALTYASELVLVTASWDWREEVANSIVLRRVPGLRDEPYWARVELREILKRRSPVDQDWGLPATDLDEDPELETIFAHGSELLDPTA